jgi:hypothetical protein
VLVHCHAGCKAEQVVAAIGLTMADLYPPAPMEPGRRGRGHAPAAEYTYVDEHGELLYQSVRHDLPGGGKRFYVRRPDGDGGWIKGLGDIRPIPYRLPDLLAADPSDWVFIVEGEKCADRLVGLGLVATTNPGGAGKWRDGYSARLAGRYVAVLPDNDEPGRRHARQVVNSLDAVAEEVRVVTLPGLPPKGDVVDWLNAGGSEAELLRLMATAPVVSQRNASSPDDPTEDTEGTKDMEGVEDTEGVDLREDVTKKLREKYDSEVGEGRPTSLSVEQMVRVAREIDRELSAAAAAAGRPASVMWHFTWAMKGHPELAGRSAHEALTRVDAAVSAWPRPAGVDAWEHAFGIDAEGAQSKFCAHWGRIVCPPGSAALQRAVGEAKADPRPVRTRFAIPSYHLFLNVVLRLQWLKGDAPVMLCTRAIAKSMGKSFDRVADWIRMAVDEELLRPVEPAIRRMRCARYRLDLTRFRSPTGDAAAAMNTRPVDNPNT